MIWVKWEKKYWNYIVATITMSIVIYLIEKINFDFVVSFIISVIGGFMTYLLFLIIAKDPLYIIAKNFISNKLNLKN